MFRYRGYSNVPSDETDCGHLHRVQLRPKEQIFVEEQDAPLLLALENELHQYLRILLVVH